MRSPSRHEYRRGPGRPGDLLVRPAQAVLSQDLVQGGHEAIRVVRGEDHGGLDLQDVLIGAVGGDQYPVVPQALLHSGGFGHRRFPGRLVEYQLDSQEEPKPSNIPHQGVPLFQGS